MPRLLREENFNEIKKDMLKNKNSDDILTKARNNIKITPESQKEFEDYKIKRLMKHKSEKAKERIR